jgi:hypothetical protein
MIFELVGTELAAVILGERPVQKEEHLILAVAERLELLPVVRIREALQPRTAARTDRSSFLEQDSQ